MFDNENKEFSEHLVTINRVAKVVKGGRRFGFAAIMIVGDNKGRVGYGTGKAKEVPEAVRKATENAKNKMIRVHLKENRTIHHDTIGRFGGEEFLAIIPNGAVKELLNVAERIREAIAKDPYPHSQSENISELTMRGMDLKQLKATGEVYVATESRRVDCDTFDYNLQTGLAKLSAQKGKQVAIVTQGVIFGNFV